MPLQLGGRNDADNDCTSNKTSVIMIANKSLRFKPCRLFVIDALSHRRISVK